MCSNFETINPNRASWVKSKFGCDLPAGEWRAEAYPTYPAPFIYLKDGQPACELAQFGLVPFWAAGKPRFGTKTYNARSETVQEKPSYRSAWRQQQFGLIIMESFFEPHYYEKNKSERWRIKRADSEPVAVASIWERFLDKATGEISFSFSMLTVNAADDPVMKHFHRPEDEKRSVVVLIEGEYVPWLNATTDDAPNFLDLAPEGYLVSEPAPKITVPKHRDLLDLL